MNEPNLLKLMCLKELEVYVISNIFIFFFSYYPKVASDTQNTY